MRPAGRGSDAGAFGYMPEPEEPGNSPDEGVSPKPEALPSGAGMACGAAAGGAILAGAGRRRAAFFGIAFFTLFFTAFAAFFAGALCAVRDFFALPLGFAADLERAATLRATLLAGRRALVLERAELFFFGSFFAICDVPPRVKFASSIGPNWQKASMDSYITQGKVPIPPVPPRRHLRAGESLRLAG